MSAIPELKAADVHSAIADVREKGIPSRRRAVKFCLNVAGAHYPPKYVVGRASALAAGRELEPNEFSGGAETNDVLRSLGFEIVSCTCGGLVEQ